MRKFTSREEYERWKAGGGDPARPPQSSAVRRSPPVEKSSRFRFWMIPAALLVALAGWLLFKWSPLEESATQPEEEEIAAEEAESTVAPLTPVNPRLGLSIEYQVQPGVPRDMEFVLLSPTPPSADRLVRPPTVGVLRMTDDQLAGRGVEAFVKSVRTEGVENSAWLMNTFGLVDWEHDPITDRQARYRAVKFDNGIWFEQWPDSEEYRLGEALFSLSPDTWQMPEPLRYIMSGFVSESQVRKALERMAKDEAPEELASLRHGAQQADLRRGKIGATLVSATFQVTIDKSSDIARIGGDGAQHLVFEDSGKTLKFWMHVMRDGRGRPFRIVGPKITPETLSRFARARFQAFAGR